MAKAFRCKFCWRSLEWQTPRLKELPWLALLLRPAKCATCGRRRLVPIFWPLGSDY